MARVVSCFLVPSTWAESELRVEQSARTVLLFWSHESFEVYFPGKESLVVETNDWLLVGCAHPTGHCKLKMTEPLETSEDQIRPQADAAEGDASERYFWVLLPSCCSSCKNLTIWLSRGVLLTSTWNCHKFHAVLKNTRSPKNPRHSLFTLQAYPTNPSINGNHEISTAFQVHKVLETLKAQESELIICTKVRKSCTCQTKSERRKGRVELGSCCQMVPV